MGQFGYDCGGFTVYSDLDKATALYIAKHLNKVAPEEVSYWFEEED